jgi:hypothetical protein
MTFRLQRTTLRLAALSTLLVIASDAAMAQQPAAPSPQPQQSPPAQQQFQPSGQWQALPRMQLERQFAGPLQDTVIQRLRDPVDGTVCYLYLPISVAHSPTTQNGFVQYGASVIGSINCMPGHEQAAAAKPPARK